MVIIKDKNCPNCGAVYTLDDVKCPYCGTLYFNMEAIDFTENKPVFIRFKINQGGQEMYMTQCAIPRLESVEATSDTVDVVDISGTILHRYYANKHCTTNLHFDAIPFGKNNEFFRINIGG